VNDRVGSLKPFEDVGSSKLVVEINVGARNDVAAGGRSCSLAMQDHLITP